MSEEFEKSLKEFESEHLTNPSGLVRKIGIYFYAVRQPEIDALKLKTESDKREWQTVVAAFDSELKRVRAENERLRKALPLTPEAVIAFIGSNFHSKNRADDLSEVRYSLTVHDLLSAFSDIAAAPTPPAQEDEPVAYYGARCHGYFQDVLIRTTDDLGSYREAGFTLIPLYTRPDGLRKAAERVEKVMRNSGYTVLADYLSAALEGTK